MEYRYNDGQTTHTVRIVQRGEGFEVCIGERSYAVTAREVDLSPWAFLPLLVLAGAAGGAGWAAIVAWLRDRFHANEILVSLMLVYVAQLLLDYFHNVQRLMALKPTPNP